MREETVVTVRICFPTSSKVRHNLVKFWMKFVTGRRHQPQQDKVSGDSFLQRVGQHENRFGKFWTGLSMERVRSSVTCYPMACGDMTGVMGPKV